MHYSVERVIGDKKLLIETGKYAEQAGGAVVVTYGDSVVLATVCISPRPRTDIDFLPLTVDYEERLYAAGRIPGSFFRREGRPGQDAILFGRLIDRPIRPLLPKSFRNEVQIILTVLSVDKENPPEIMAMIGASAALSMSPAPFDGPIGASRVSHAHGVYTLNPTFDAIKASDLSVVVAGTKDAVMMVEAGANETPEAVVLEAISRAQECNRQVIDMIQELVAAAGSPTVSFVPKPADHELEARVDAVLNGRLSEVLDGGPGKQDQALEELEQEVKERLADQYQGAEVSTAFEGILKGLARARILDRGLRPDGRRLDEIRPISCEVGLLPRTHGSGLFTRGQTQVMSIATLASLGMQQKLDSLSPDETKRFIHHYNFMPFSTGEVKRLGSSGRREIGHGALAERAIEPMVPAVEEFPYAIRLVSEVLSSNGSTSMASVCGGTLALMDAGVPIERPVSGVAMGLVMGEDGRYSVLTDIQGIEDHLGDMDFKVAGTASGINALQMDIKVKGVTQEVLTQALSQAKEARMYILEKMREAIAEPRPGVSPYAPKLHRMMIPVDKIGALIGPGGRVIRGIQEELGVTIDTEDDGTVIIGSSDAAAIEAARARIDGLTRDIAVGDIFTGKVMRLASFGAFVQLVLGKDGLLRTGELGDQGDELNLGDEITVVVQEIDSMGRINLSQRALLDGPGSGRSAPRGGPPRPQQGPPRPPGPGSRGGPGFRGDRGPSGGGRPPPRPSPYQGPPNSPPNR